MLESFEGSIITFKGSGALYPMQVNILCEMLHRLIYDDSWSKALALCRRTQVNFNTIHSIALKKNTESYTPTILLKNLKT